jgi:hypothetical protein
LHRSPGTSSGLHHDYHDNLYALLCGSKTFHLYPPSDAPNMYTHGAARAAAHASATSSEDDNDDSDRNRAAQHQQRRRGRGRVCRVRPNGVIVYPTSDVSDADGEDGDISGIAYDAGVALLNRGGGAGQ